MRQEFYSLLHECFHLPVHSADVLLQMAGQPQRLEVQQSQTLKCISDWVLIACLLMLKPSAHAGFPRVVLMVIRHFVWQPVEVIQVREALVALVSTKTTDSFGPSELKKTQLMSSHLYKYLSGDCLILQALETYPSVPTSWSLQCPLHLILWHCVSDFFLCKKVQVLALPSEEKPAIVQVPS